MDTTPLTTPSQPEQPVSTPPMTPLVPRRNWWPIVIIVVTALVAIYLAAAYFTSIWPFAPDTEIQASPTPSVSVTPDVTDNWKTYTNTYAQFSFRYPADVTISERDTVYPSDPTKHWLMITGRGGDLDLRIDINNPGRGASGIYNPVTGMVVADGVSITYQAGKILPMGETVPGNEFLWQMQFEARGNDYIVEFTSRDGVDRTTLVNGILSTFRFTNIAICQTPPSCLLYNHELSVWENRCGDVMQEPAGGWCIPTE